MFYLFYIYFLVDSRIRLNTNNGDKNNSGNKQSHSVSVNKLVVDTNSDSIWTESKNKKRIKTKIVSSIDKRINK